MDSISLPEEFAGYWSYSNAGQLSEAVRQRDDSIRSTAKAEALKEAAELLKEIAGFGSPDGRRGEAIAYVRRWVYQAKAILADTPADERGPEVKV